VHHPSTVPDRRHRAIQSAKHTGRVPAHADPLLHHRSCTPAWHRVASTMPPSPWPHVAQTDPGEPYFSHTRTEPDRKPTGPLRHRRSAPNPWTLRTMPSLSADHDAQWSPTQAHHRSSPRRQIKAEAPSGSHPSLSFAPLHSLSPAGAHRRAAEMKSSPENASSSVRSSAGRGEGCGHPSLSLDLSGSRVRLHRLDLTFLCFWTRTRRS
jgi:hypothetical protein